MPDATEKLAQWRLSISEFEFNIAHRAGIKHRAADVLSRFKTGGEEKRLLNYAVPVLTISNRYSH